MHRSAKRPHFQQIPAGSGEDLNCRSKRACFTQRPDDHGSKWKRITIPDPGCSTNEALIVENDPSREVTGIFVALRTHCHQHMTEGPINTTG